MLSFVDLSCINEVRQQISITSQKTCDLYKMMIMFNYNCHNTVNKKIIQFHKGDKPIYKVIYNRLSEMIQCFIKCMYMYVTQSYVSYHNRRNILLSGHNSSYHISCILLHFCLDNSIYYGYNISSLYPIFLDY